MYILCVVAAKNSGMISSLFLSLKIVLRILPSARGENKGSIQATLLSICRIQPTLVKAATWILSGH